MIPNLDGGSDGGVTPTPDGGTDGGPPPQACGDLIEDNVLTRCSSWSEDNAQTNLSTLGAPDVIRGSSSLRAVTQSGFDFALRYMVAYLDFANSMAYRWAHNERWNLDDAVACYPDRVPVNGTSLRAAIQEIEQLPSTTIEEIVTRIPEEFLSVAHRTTILEALLHRQSRVRGMMANVYPGIP